MHRTGTMMMVVLQMMRFYGTWMSKKGPSVWKLHSFSARKCQFHFILCHAVGVRITIMNGWVPANEMEGNGNF